jgi:NAD-dependent dihydropyrimidine dehydrogenase PreA subunit
MISNRVLRKRWGSRVIPLKKNISHKLKFSPTQEIKEIVKRSDVSGVSWCYCRSSQRKDNISKCDHPLYTCIHLASGSYLREIPFKSLKLKKASKDEIYKILDDSDKRGLVHQLIFFPNPDFYYVICNCCPCCCVVLSNFLEKGAPKVIESDFIAVTDVTRCLNCGDCVGWCYFTARIMDKDILIFNDTRCFGCGICVSKCPQNAIVLKKKS